MSFLRNIRLNIPSLILAFVMALVVWIFAVSSSDPVEEHVYQQPLSIELQGLDDNLIVTNDLPEQVFVTIKAPLSVWNQLESDQNLVHAYVDITDLEEGKYTPDIDIEVDAKPIEIISIVPSSCNVTLQKLSSKSFSIRLIRSGEPAVGYQAEVPKLSQTTAEVKGPEAKVEQISGIIATLDLDGTDTDINSTINLQAVDSDDNVINGIDIIPDKITVNQSINQLGGYRNLAVKVVVKGQISVGYRLTSISAYPAAVTVFSSNPDDVNSLPGYVETQSIDVSGIKDDLDVQVPLSLPANVSVVGDEYVQVQVGVAAIEGSMTLDNMAVTITGLADGLKATTSPESVDVIISGPLPTLDSLTDSDVKVYVDLSDKYIGTYQKVPQVELAVADLRITSILPESIEVTIEEDENHTKENTDTLDIITVTSTPLISTITVIDDTDMNTTVITETVENESDQSQETPQPEPSPTPISDIDINTPTNE